MSERGREKKKEEEEMEMYEERNEYNPELSVDQEDSLLEYDRLVLYLTLFSFSLSPLSSLSFSLFYLSLLMPPV